MPENNVRNNIIHQTADDNWIRLAKNSARAYRKIGVITEREYNEVLDTNDINVIQSIIGDIPNMEVPMRLKFCKSFVGDDTENFNGATPAILSYAYMATRGEDTPVARALATRIDEMSADFANSGGMVLDNGTDWPLVNLSNIADVYEGFVNALVARMADLDASRDAAKIAEMKSNLAQMETVINDYDAAWGLDKVRIENAPQYEHRWDELNNALDGAGLFNETKEQIRKYNFTDKNKETIPQFLENGELDPDGRAAALLDLTRGDIARRRVTDLNATVNADEIEQELNNEFLIKLYETANADKIVQMATENPEVFMDPQKRAEFVRGLGNAGGEISDAAYNAALDENANATAGWGARFKKKLGTAAEKIGGFFGKVFHRNEKVDRLSGVRMAPQPVDMRQKRIELFKRVLKGFASAFIASAIITTVATAAAATAGISLAASMAAIGIITAIGMGVIQVNRWRRAQKQAGAPTDIRAFLADKRLLSSLGVSAIAVIAMCFGAAGMAEAAMALGYGALALGGTKNAVEAYHDARNSRTADGKRMSVAESIAWAIANAGAVVAGGMAGRMVANVAINTYNDANPENRLFQDETTRTERQEFTKEVERSKTVTDYTDKMLEGAKGRVESWYRDNPDLLQQRIDAIEQYNIEHGTDINPYRALNVIGLAGEQTPDNMMLHVNNGGSVPSHGQHGVYTGPKWQNTYGYTPEQIDLAAHTFNPDGTINSACMDIVRDLDLHHLGVKGTVGVVDGVRGAHTDGVLPQNDIARGGEVSANGRVHSVYAPLGETPTQHTETWNEIQTEYKDVNVTDYMRASDGGANRAAFGNYNPRKNKTTPRDRIGAFWDKIETEQPRREERTPVEPPVQDKPSQEVIIDDVPVVEEKPVVEGIIDEFPAPKKVTEEVPVIEKPEIIVDVFPDPKKVTKEIPVTEEPQPEIIVDEVPVPEKTDIDFDDVFPAPIDNEPENEQIIEPVVEDTTELDVVPGKKILALTRPQAKAWHDLNARRNKVREKLRKSPHASKAAKLHAQESKLTYLINKLCNEVGHHDYAAIDRAANEALLREALNEKQALIDAGPGANATKWDIADWRADIAKLDRTIQKKIDKFGTETLDGAMADKSDLYFPSPVPGVQRQKKNARGDVKLPSENDLVPVFEDVPNEKMVFEPVKTFEQPKQIIEPDVAKPVEPVRSTGKHEHQITSIRGVPVKLMDLDGRGGIVTDGFDKPVVVVEINQSNVLHDGVPYDDVIRIPFCLTTVVDKRTKRPVRGWYPARFLKPNGHTIVNEGYANNDLLEIGSVLNRAIGDKYDLNVATHVDNNLVIAEIVDSNYGNRGLYAQGVDYASYDPETLSWVLGKIKSSDYRGFAAGTQRLGKRLIHGFGLGHRNKNKNQY